jgi:hypothetical protein
MKVTHDKTRRGSTRAFLAASAALVVCLSGVALKGSQTPSPQRPPMAEEVFKNLTVLRGIPVDQFMGTMGFFSSATGLNCTDCHVDESGGDWARYADDNALKQTTRRMVLMVSALNRTNFGGRQVVMEMMGSASEAKAVAGVFKNEPK